MGDLYTVSPAVSLPGIKVRILRNTKISDPNSLLDWANKQLSKLREPPASYRMDIRDLSAARQDSDEALAVGAVERIIDEDLSLSVDVRLTGVEQSLTDPMDVNVEFRTDSHRDPAEIVADLQQEEEIDDKTDWLPSDTIHLDDDGHNLDDWQYDSDPTLMDGEQLAPDTTQAVWMAKITADTTAGEIQSYTVTLLDPDDKSETEVSIEGCLVPDDDAARLSSGDYVVVVVPSAGARALGDNAFIVASIGGTGGMQPHGHATAASGHVTGFNGAW